jgi:hypothetical protein
MLHLTLFLTQKHSTSDNINRKKFFQNGLGHRTKVKCLPMQRHARRLELGFAREQFAHPTAGK